DYRTAVLQGAKDVFEAETAVTTAERTRATLERQMFQAGMDPRLLGTTASGTAIVVADVPETRKALVQAGQACVGRVFAFKDKPFKAKVATLSPTVSKERRTLKVFFSLEDPGVRLRPGMFAEIGLDADPRLVLLVPTDAVLHVAGADYVLVGGEGGVWRI